MGILTLGLLGVAAMFPVGSYFMQKGDVADRSSAVAQSAFSDLVARGILDPENWLQYEEGSNKNPPGNPPNSWANKLFSRPFATAMRNQIELFKHPPFNYTTSGPFATGPGEVPFNALGQRALNSYFGSFYVIDPLSVSSSQGSAAPSAPDIGWRMFPFMHQNGWVFLRSNLKATEWHPWTMPSGGSQGIWPMVRVTLSMPDPANPGTYIPMTRAVAEALFSSHDDLAIDLPSSQDQSSMQRWQVDKSTGTPTALARQSRGDYSWMVTVAPPTVMARNALANPSSDSYNYDVSVVVFHKRALDTMIPGQSNQIDETSQSEMLVSSAIKSTGPSGGELLLSAAYFAKPPYNNPFDNLKAGEWMMLCGPHPQSTDMRPMFFAQWYKVVAIDKEIAPADQISIGGKQVEQRYVTVRGPQWPWQASGQGYSTTYNSTYYLSDNLCACIMPGAVAVHTKTVRLEGNSLFNGGSVGSGSSNYSNVGF